MTCGTAKQKRDIWRRLTVLPATLPRRLLTEILEDAEANMGSVESLLVSVEKLEAYERYETSGLDKALHGFIDRIPIYNTAGVIEPLAVLVSGLNDYLEREPYVVRRECHISKEFSWLLESGNPRCRTIGVVAIGCGAFVREFGGYAEDAASEDLAKWRF